MSESKYSRKYIQDLREEAEPILSALRKEAVDAKQCFTQFSFQTLTITSAALAIIVSTITEAPFAVFASIPAIGILEVLSRIGIYKYSAANRAYGFKSYIENTENYLISEKVSQLQNSEDLKALEIVIKNSNWEQLFRAWRILEPSVFESIYETPNSKNFFKRFLIEVNVCKIYKIKSQFLSKFEKDNKKTPASTSSWFFIYDSTSKKYRSGTYLRRMLELFQLVKLIFLALLIYGGIKLVRIYHFQTPSVMVSAKIYFILFVLTFITILFIGSHFRILRRLRIIERELQSIHGYSVIWNLVIIAHYRSIEFAKHEISSSTSQDLRHNLQQFDELYLDNITLETSKVVSQIHNLKSWLCGPK